MANNKIINNKENISSSSGMLGNIKETGKMEEGMSIVPFYNKDEDILSWKYFDTAVSGAYYHNRIRLPNFSRE